MHVTSSARTKTSPHIAYWTAGTKGPRVLLLMGFGMRGDIWRPQVEGLEGQHRLAWLDNRGVGESDRTRGTWTMEDMAGDALRVMDELGWDQCHVVGVSMGGMIAQHLALAAEHRVKSLTLIATHEGGTRWVPTLEGIRKFLRANMSQGAERIAALRELLYPPEFLAVCDLDAMEKRMAAQVGRPADRGTLLAHLAAVARHRTGPRLGRLSVPTLIVRPGRDVLVPPSASDRLRKRIAHARVLELPDAGHGAIFQCMDEVNAALAAHFADAEATAVAQRPATIHA